VICAVEAHPESPHIVRLLGYDLGWTAIILESGDVFNLVESEIRRIGDRRIADGIRELAVAPYPVERSWDYGEPGERYTCWTVLEHAASNTGIAYFWKGSARRILGASFFSQDHI
jgi:hypothetical protein